jgi:hypothetical protein
MSAAADSWLPAIREAAKSRVANCVTAGRFRRAVAWWRWSKVNYILAANARGVIAYASFAGHSAAFNPPFLFKSRIFS